MQAANDATLTAAVSGTTRRPVSRLLVDWNRTGLYDHPLSDVSSWVSAVSVDRALTGGLPAEASQVAGYASAELTATLGGTHPDTGSSALDTLAPYRTSSALPKVIVGCPVRWEVGFAGTTLVRQFTGYLRSMSADSGSREVRIAALDPADRLRAPITLPAYGLHRDEVLRSGHRFLVNPQWVIDYCLRRNGIYASPPAHPAAQISCTGHGAYAAEVGRNAVPRGTVGITIPGDQSWWVPGPPQFAPMTASRGVWETGHGAYQEFFTRESFRPIPGTGVGIGAWVKVGTGMTDVPGGGSRKLFELMPLVDHDAFRFQVWAFSDGKIGAYVWDSIGGFQGSGAVATGADGWRYIGVHWRIISSTQVTISWRRDGGTLVGTYTIPALRSAFAQAMQMTAWTSRAWCNMHVWYDGGVPSAPWPGETHTSQAAIDPGLNELLYLPDVVAEDSWDVCKEVAQAEYANVGFREDGAFFFAIGGWSIGDPTTVEAEVTADRSLLDAASEITTDSIRNVVTTDTTPSYLTFAGSIIDSKNKLDFESPVGIWVFDVPLPHGAIGTTTQTIPQIPSASWSAAYLWGYVAVRSDLEAEEIPTGQITVTYAQVGDRLGRIQVRNYSEYPARFCTTGGSPALRVQGWSLSAEPKRVERFEATGSIAEHRPRAYPIAASQWRQQPAPLRTVAGGLLAQLANPVPIIKDIEVVGDPRLQLGDTVRMIDPAGQGSLRATVVKVRLRFDRKLTSVLTIRPVAPPGLGILDDPELGLLDSTLIMAP